MSNSPQSIGDHLDLPAYCKARESVDAATVILNNLIDEDRLYLMPKRESRKLLKHTKRLLELAAEALGDDRHEQKEEVTDAK